MEIDWSVGEVIKALKKNNIEQNTLIIYASDNGPWLNYGKWGGSAGQLREGKGSMWEGGARVPCIMRWPEKIKPGTISSNIAATIDILPTLAEITGVENIKNKIDGKSLMPILNGIPGANPRNELYYYFAEKLIAVRKGKYKLVFPHIYRSYDNVIPGENLHPGAYSQGKAGLELYNLESDIGEKTDLALRLPMVVKELQNIGEKARSILGDKLTDRIGSESYETLCGSSPPAVKFNHLAIGNDIRLNNKPHKNYPGESISSLVNGIGGTVNYRDPSWQGFEATDLYATIDLGKIKSVKSIKVRFLQDQVVWIFLPEKVQIEHSVDGKNFELIHESFPSNDFSFTQDIFEFDAEIDEIESRYIRVKGYNINSCPDYHPGAGGKSWIFADEIIIR